VPGNRWDQKAVTESRAIASFLDGRYPPSLTDSPHLEAAATVAQPVFGKFAKYCKSTEDGGADDDQAKKELLLALCNLDAHLASHRPFLCGERMSLEDAFLFPALYHLTVAGRAFKDFEVPSQFESLLAYRENAFSSPAFRASRPPEAMVRWGWAGARGDHAAAEAAAEELRV
jgi:glutathione S-transferase